jgi:hypothetical protein
MQHSDNYEYVNEAAIDSALICTICQEPLKDPRITACGHVFCRDCITEWIRGGNQSCPTCREPVADLMHVNRPLENILGNLEVKCTMCGQMRLKRSDFANHMNNVCPKAAVICLAADIMCRWVGHREELNDHINQCEFQRVRPTLDQLIMENEYLKEQLTQTNTQNDELFNSRIEAQRAKSARDELMVENNQLMERLTRIRAQNEELINNPRREQSKFISGIHKHASDNFEWFIRYFVCIF